MRIVKSIVLLILLGSANVTRAGETLGWFTCGHSRYISSPGLEASYLFSSRFGLDLGLGMYIQNPDHLQLTGIIHSARFGFYQANFGLSGYVYKKNLHRVGLNAGVKIYYGPDYRLLRYDPIRNENIYFDGSSLQPDYGLDLGIYYVYKRITVLCKWDFARNRFRAGLGYKF